MRIEHRDAFARKTAEGTDVAMAIEQSQNLAASREEGCGLTSEEVASRAEAQVELADRELDGVAGGAGGTTSPTGYDNTLKPDLSAPGTCIL